jgi:hypothetical protein
MNKERELLNRCAEAFALHNKCPNLVEEIQELLAQPEQEPFRGLRLNGDSYSQEPSIWQYRYQMDEEGWGAWCSCSEDDYLAYQTPDMFENVTYETRKLYTSPPKREPLGEIEIRSGYNANLHMTMKAFNAGVKFAEKAHGIGVDNVK